MSEPTREEMLEWLNNEITKYDFLGITHPHLWQAPTNRDCKIYQAIRRLIEARLIVNRGFLEERIKSIMPRLWYDLDDVKKGTTEDGQYPQFINGVIHLLHEAGIKIEKKKEAR